MCYIYVTITYIYIYICHNNKKKYWEAEENIVFNRILLIFLTWWRIQFSSVTQSCLTLCDPMSHKNPGLPVHHQLLEYTQTHVY